MQKIYLAGGTGFIGTYLKDYLSKQNWKVIIISRRKDSAFLSWKDLLDKGFPDDSPYYLLNLAGQSIATIWTRKNREKIFNSRLQTIENIKKIITISKRPPQKIFQLSAGFYGYFKDEPLTEQSKSGEGFLASVAAAVEEKAVHLFPEAIIIRSAIVLGKGGFLKQIHAFNRFFPLIYPSISNERNFFSFIHIGDWAEALLYLINNKTAEKIFNFSAPYFCSTANFYQLLFYFSRKLIKIKLNKNYLPCFLKEQFEEIFFTNQLIIPHNLEKAGYKFKFSDINQTLSDIFQS